MHAKSGKTDVQEFLLLPMNDDGFALAAEANARVHREVAKVLEERGKTPTGKTDEGAWVSSLTTEEAFESVCEASETIGGEMGFEVRVGADFAASSLWDGKTKRYVYQTDRRRLDGGDQFEFMRELIERFKLIYVEDPFHEDAFDEFAELTKLMPKTLVCGDDLFVTNLARFRRGSEIGAGNSIIIKPNQVGTITDAKITAEAAREMGYVTITSHRSGDLPQTELVDLAMAFGSPIIKAGAVGGRTAARLNELMRLEEELGNKARLVRLEKR
jgi:enolase